MALKRARLLAESIELDITERAPRQQASSDQLQLNKDAQRELIDLLEALEEEAEERESR